MFDLCIIGGGASGMTAAIKSKQINKEISVAILEKNSSLGKKLLATGNGKCNLSNTECKDYRKVLTFFESIGVLTRTKDEGRIYPYSEEAAEVVSSLEQQLISSGVEIYCDTEVLNIKKIPSGFEIEVMTVGINYNLISYQKQIEKEKFLAKNILIATGGKSDAQFGTTGDGYKWARELGHTVTRLAPVLTPVECTSDFKKFKGIRQDATCTLYKNNQIVAKESGNLQMTEYGLSGICIFDLTRYINVEQDEEISQAIKSHEIGIDYLPDISMDTTIEILDSRCKIKGISAINIMRTIVKKEIAREVLRRANIEENILAIELESEQIETVAKLLKDLRWNVNSIKGWQFAQVTKGGVVLDEINEDTMESKICKGLFFAGEVLDYDGPCGGFNLQHAWETGLKVGEDVASNMTEA